MSAQFFFAAALLFVGATMFAQGQSRPRARDLGIEIGVLPPGPLNAITDVSGVKVGETTIIRGDNIRTGVTAILPPEISYDEIRLMVGRVKKLERKDVPA
jgi:hypothetical protein